MSAFDKLDVGLILALRAFEESGSAPADDGISVSLRFQGDLAKIEALGFETTMVEEEGEARGVIRFRDVGAVSSHPNVLWIAAGQSRRPYLDKATRDAVVRSAAAGDVGTTGLWHVPDAGGTLTTTASGKGVIVAVIDTGIDYTHPMFMSQLRPIQKTRIIRIWDQGLTPSALTECPAASLLSSGGTYGVQFTQQQINDAIKPGGTILPHRDCYHGHGTHCAGIAAGGPLFATGGDAKIVGVAPEADIIAVKLLDNPDEIKFRTATGFGVKVGYDDRLKDAVMYCLRVARDEEHKSVVINMSFGDDSLPGDALDPFAVWLDGVLDPTKPSGPDNFPTGAIAVKAFGNEGDDSERMLAKITFAAAGRIIVPLELVDGRAGKNTARRNCKLGLYDPAIPVDLWYRRDPAVKFAWRVPGQTSPGMAIGLTPLVTEGYKFTVSPPTATSVPPSPTVHRIVVNHLAPPAVAHPAGPPSVERNHFRFSVEPKKVSGTIDYLKGSYGLAIDAPKDTVLFLQCGWEDWGHGHSVLFKVADPAPAGVSILKTQTAADPLGRHAISVANYNDANGSSSDPAFHNIVAGSSQGPLRDYSIPPRPIIAKPDLAGPGEKITSAASIYREQRPTELWFGKWYRGVRFDELSGSSMAAPFVAGVVAAMLQKKPALTITQVRTALRDAAALRPGAGPGGVNAFGAGMVHGFESHKKA